MKYYILKAIIQYLKGFKKIKLIKRVENNTILIEFDGQVIYFDLAKGNSSIYIKPTRLSTKDYNAPFDVMLKKRFSNSKISDIYLKDDDKIIAIETINNSRYKKESTTLLLEFTSNYTNIIITDQNQIILEALRHIDNTKSSRIIEVGIALSPLPPKKFEFNKQEFKGDIVCYLEDNYRQKEQKELSILKTSKLKTISKQIKTIQNILDNLEDETQLNNSSSNMYETATLILNNLHQIKPYQKEFETYNYNGELVTIKLENISNIPLYANNMFKKAKKLKQKAKNIYKERDNLSEKLVFLQRLYKNIQNSDSVDRLEFLYPKKQKNQTKTKKSKPYQEFFIDGYKIMIGRDERENVYLLQNAKASDFWFHLKDRKSCHLIVSNTKKTLPQKIIELSAKLCIDFSVESGGKYEVDYTQRRNIKIVSGANVLYNPYKTYVANIKQ
jgi:predicted ribosome quality control (RQC) complex YloA/Tae2 family protein